MGLLSDCSRGFPRLGLGRRKLWNAIGVAIVVVAFWFVFGECLLCAIGAGEEGPAGNWHRTIAFAAFASLFNVGWAAVQVSHMALVPELTPDDHERVLLNSARYAFTVLASVYVYAVMFVILRVTDGDGGDPTRPYTLLTYFVLGLGGLLSAVFLFGTREPAAPLEQHGALVDEEDDHGYPQSRSISGQYTLVPPEPTPVKLMPGGTGERRAGAADALRRPHSASDVRPSAAASSSGSRLAVPLVPFGGEKSSSTGAPASSASGEPSQKAASASAVAGAPRRGVAEVLGGDRPRVMRWRDWLRMPTFWLVACVYMLVRLATNVSQVYLTFFVQLTLEMPAVAIAIVPLLAYLSQLVATVTMKRLNKRLGRRNSITLGGLCFAAACAGMLFTQPSFAPLVYALVLLLGAGSAIAMVVSVSMEADLVGRNTESAAFVYGAISFTDKLSNGGAVLGIQFIWNGIGDAGTKATFVRYVNCLVPAAAIVLAIVVAWFIKFPKHLCAVEAAPGASRGQGSVNQQHGAGADKLPLLARIRSFLRSDANLDIAALRAASPDAEPALVGEPSDRLLATKSASPGGR